jgi:agmatine deiminase
MSREEIEAGLCEHLGVHTVVWLEHGLVEDRDTDGHVDLIAAFTKPGEVLLQAGAPGSEDERRMEVNRERLEAAGLAVRRLEVLPHVEVAGEQIAVSHMNFYLCNGGIVVPLSGQDTDAEALRVIGEAYPDHEVVGVPGAVLAFGGGGPHCITQQVPARLRA